MSLKVAPKTKGPMTPSEARECLKAARERLSDARQLLLELYEREGWKALGYASWRECVAAEFEESQAHLYRLLWAARVERDVSPVGEFTHIPESILRPLADPDLTPGVRRAAFERARGRAGDALPTEAQVEESLDEIMAEAFDHLSPARQQQVVEKGAQKSARDRAERERREREAEQADRLENAEFHQKQALRHLRASGRTDVKVIERKMKWVLEALEGLRDGR